METFVAAVMTIAAAIWMGAIVFQSAVVAPAVFVDLDEAAARAFLRTLFPRFFRLGLVCGALMLAALLGHGVVAGWTTTTTALAVMASLMLVLEAISLGLVPHINAARDAGQAGEADFGRLHRTSVLLTVAILLVGVAFLAIIAARAAAGI